MYVLAKHMNLGKEIDVWKCLKTQKHRKASNIVICIGQLPAFNLKGLFGGSGRDRSSYTLSVVDGVLADQTPLERTSALPTRSA